jgi:hypothetical protein
MAALSGETAGSDQDPGDDEAHGFVIPGPLRRELAGLTPESCVPKRLRQVLTISAGDESDDPALAAALTQSTKRLTWHADPEVGSWNSIDKMNSFYIPAQTLSTITDAVKAWR